MNIQKIINEDLGKFSEKEYIFEKRNGKYEAIRFNEFVGKARVLATRLIDAGLKDERIMLVGKNSTNLMIADVAVTVYTGVCVNTAAGFSAEDLEGLIESLGIKAVLYGDDQTEKVAELTGDFMKMNIDEIMPELSEVRDNYKKYNPDECAKIVFTGGTTSKPKGVMLSLKNMFYGWPYLKRRAEFLESDIMYLFLPLHHTYANLYIFYYSLMSGLSIYLCSDVAKIGEELLEVRPTILGAVPLIYERLAEAYHGEVGGAFGDRIRFLFAGGAPISEGLKRVYKKCGLEILNAYALSETASSFAVSYPGDTDEDDVGTVYEDLEVKIIDAGDSAAGVEAEAGVGGKAEVCIGGGVEVGEICVKGDCVFLGYTTPDVDCFTEDGFFKTGDLGYVKNGKLFVTGRKKKVLIGSNGENIYPDDLLLKLKEMDANVNDVRFSLAGDKLHAEFFLVDAEKTDLDELVKSFNVQCAKKDWISDYELSQKKKNEKLL